MKELLTRKLTETEKDLIAVLFTVIGILLIALGVRSPLGGGNCPLTYYGMFTMLGALGMMANREQEED